MKPSRDHTTQLCNTDLNPRSNRDVGPYLGLTPNLDQSGATVRHDRGDVKQGRVYVRVR